MCQNTEFFIEVPLNCISNKQCSGAPALFFFISWLLEILLCPCRTGERQVMELSVNTFGFQTFISLWGFIHKWHQPKLPKFITPLSLSPTLILLQNHSKYPILLSLFSLRWSRISMGDPKAPLLTLGDPIAIHTVFYPT